MDGPCVAEGADIIGDPHDHRLILPCEDKGLVRAAMACPPGPLRGLRSDPVVHEKHPQLLGTAGPADEVQACVVSGGAIDHGPADPWLKGLQQRHEAAGHPPQVGQSKRLGLCVVEGQVGTNSIFNLGI